MQDFLSQFPATAGALEGLEGSLGRFQTMVTAFDSQLDNYDTIKDTALYPIALIVLVAGLLIIVCGAWMFLAERDRMTVADWRSSSRLRAGHTDWLSSQCWSC